MKTDRELLILAGKASGMPNLDFDYPERDGHNMYFGPRLPMPEGVLMAAMHTYWDPLTSDGDALRLAVQLEIEISFINGDTHADGQSEGGPDKLSNTRYAIVRAAAAIGEQMP
jgi:hypothetical protein